MRLLRKKYFFYTGVLVFILYFIIANKLAFLKYGNRQLQPIRNLLPKLVSSGKPVHEKCKAVIIVTYMRSGSSLLGDMLQQSPGAFYLYEPLHSLGRIYTKYQTNLSFVNGTRRLWPFNFLEEGVNIIRQWLRCATTNVLKRGLRDGFMEKGIRSGGFRQCYYQHRSMVENNSAYVYRQCALGLKATCTKSSLIVIKTIRMPLKVIGRLLGEVPGLKIIHLIRDPRATLMSQSVFGLCTLKNGGFFRCSSKLCTRLENDILESSVLQKRYPQRVKTLFYETIAAHPIEAAKDAFRFIGRPLTASAKQYIFNITQAGNPRDCAICTTRSNSSAHIDAWRYRMKDWNLKIIEERCNYVLQRFNYTLYSSRTVIP